MKTNKLRCLFALLACCLCTCVAWSQPRVSAHIDSLRMVVGEQTRISLNVSGFDGQKVAFPTLEEGSELMKGLEVVVVMKPDTQVVDDAKVLSQQFLVTAWDSARYEIPPFTVKVGDKEYETKSLALQVYGLAVDTADVSKIYGPNEIMDAPFSWDDWKWVIYSSFIAVFLMMLCAVMYYWLCNGNPIIMMFNRKPKLPAHVVALNTIEALRSERRWESADIKDYYTELTDALRTYIGERYSFNAMEMTTSEIIDRLQTENEPEELAMLNELLSTADLVKFAKHMPRMTENDNHLAPAAQYVERTKLEVDPNAKAETPHISADDVRNRGINWVLRILIFVCGASCIGLIVWIFYRAFQLWGIA